MISSKSLVRVESSQVKSSQVKSSQVKSSQVKSSQVKSSQVKSSRVKSSQVKSSQVKLSSQIKSSHPSFQVKSKSLDSSQQVWLLRILKARFAGEVSPALPCVSSSTCEYSITSQKPASRVFIFRATAHLKLLSLVCHNVAKVCFANFQIPLYQVL